MPFNGSGTFTLAQPAFVAGTTISSSAVNSDLSDIANNGLTKCVTVDGQTTITGAIKFTNGTVAAPAISFVSETNSGWYWASSHNIRFAVNGADVITATATGVSITGALSFSGAINEGEVTIASSATVAIGAAAGNYILISGVVTITAFDSLTAGAERTLEFQGILTLTHNGTTLILPGASNIQTAAGDVAKFRSEGSGNWRCVNYMRATPQPPPALANPWSGFDTAQNLQLTASSISGNTLLQVAVKNSAGNDPTVAAPVWIPFRNPTSSSGAPAWVAVTAALSIDTNAAGATLGTQSNVPFRLWVLAFNNSGTVVLALWHSGAGAATLAINPLDESSSPTTVAMSAAATSSGVFYTPNGTTFSKKFRILGYLDYTAGLGTAGTYASAPTIVQLFGPGIKKPGDVVQSQYTSTTTTTSVSTTAKVATALTSSLVTTSNANPVKVAAFGNINTANTGGSTGAILCQIWRNTAAVAVGNVQTYTPGVSGNQSGVGVSLFVLDGPSSSNWPPTQYGVYISDTAGTVTWTLNGTNCTSPQGPSTMIVEEIMG